MANNSQQNKVDQGLIEIASFFKSAGYQDEEAAQYAQIFIQAAGGSRNAKQYIMQMKQQGAQDSEIAQQIIQQLSEMAQSARNGAQLNYLSSLRSGGKLVDKAACGKKVKKKEEGDVVQKEACGGKSKKIKKAKKGEKVEEPEQSGWQRFMQAVRDLNQVRINNPAGIILRDEKDPTEREVLSHLYSGYSAAPMTLAAPMMAEWSLPFLMGTTGLSFYNAKKGIEADSNRSKEQTNQKVETEKCGGKAKKSRKGEFGLKSSKCPCSLKRVGGKIVQVDCYGNIIK